MASSFRLPKCVHNGALLLANVAIVPKPSLWIDGLTNAAQDPEGERKREDRAKLVSFKFYSGLTGKPT